MVPCPENTPLPNRRISKESRAKLFSVYLCPWTLSSLMATTDMPFIVDLAWPPAVQDELADTQMLAFRPTWKEYLASVLPRHERGARSFLPTCLAEGRAGDDDKENCRVPGIPSRATCPSTARGTHCGRRMPGPEIRNRTTCPRWSWKRRRERWSLQS